MATGGQHTGLKQLLTRLPAGKPVLVWIMDIELYRGLYGRVVEEFLYRVRDMPLCIVAMTTRNPEKVGVSLRSLCDDHLIISGFGTGAERIRLIQWFAQADLSHRNIEDVALRTQGKTAAEIFSAVTETINRIGKCNNKQMLSGRSKKLGMANLVYWDDIGGLDTTIEELKENIVWPILHRERFKRLGITPPRGVLLYGPPGTGKTMLARAAATEISASFISVAIPDLIKGEVGESEKALASIFDTAKRSPSIVFLDEIEAIFGSRDQAGEVGKKLISQLFLEMDNIPDDSHLVILAATNAPDLMDKSILRAGRLDKRIYVPRPSYASRVDILQRITKHLDIEDREALLPVLAEMEMSGAEIKSLVRSACYSAIQRGSKVLIQSDFGSAAKTLHTSF
ncbi:hypothetical protein LPJ64_003344 [Coemansia asiatica]|uniref:AAA+ ATPase domain-containing protein n=1 Tax=Coemansia asiatica TaxID=1052880 RepID=A0A9W7XLX4_9FUNG|nr:hypothetical protein LPJ64_003344 [Coemansia asiatica]